MWMMLLKEADVSTRLGEMRTFRSRTSTAAGLGQPVDRIAGL
jgi:hypothetical protein